MRYLFGVCFLICALLTQAQTIKGTVSDTNETVPFVIVVVKKFRTPNTILKYTTTNENGVYEIKLPAYEDSLVVEVSSPSHELLQKNLFGTLNKNGITTLNFNLQKRITSLQEVLIKAKEKPITVKGDTTTYNPDSFKDGSEKVIEDLLKKLPGIKVEANGDIKFKGKIIKKMLLDGDDLFDSQYKIGSKNISVDLVDKVQAIEDFNDNPLLKGIKDSDDVVLNIKLKKGKTDFSGNSEIGYGIRDKYKIRVTGLLVNSRFKGFGLTTYNNIGNNPSPYSIESAILTDENRSDERLYASEIINQGNFYSPLENQYSNINNNFYSTLNTLFKVSKDLKARINAGFYADKAVRTTTSLSEYVINDVAFNTTEIEKATKKPKIFNADIQLFDKSSKQNNWEYTGNVKIKDVDFIAKSSNNDLIQTNDLKTKAFFTKHNINYTTLINDTNVFIVSALFSKSNAPQEYVVSPGTNIDSLSNTQIDENRQSSNFSKEKIAVNAEVFGKFHDYKWNLKTGYASTTDQYQSSLILRNAENPTVPENFYNDNNYEIGLAYSDFNISLKKEKFTVNVGLGFQYYDLNFEDNLENSDDNKQLAFTPSLKFTHKLSKKSALIYNYGFSQTVPNEVNLFEGLVQTSYRSFRNNNANLDFIKTHNFSFGYRYTGNMFDRNRILAIASYRTNKNNYLTESLINPNTTLITTSLFNAKSDVYSFTLSSGAYVHSIRTTIDLDVNYDINLFNDIVNNSALRNITSKSLNIELTMRRGIQKLFYFESKTTYFNNIYLLENESKNRLNNLRQDLKIAFNNQKRFTANVTMNFVSTDLAVNNNYWFLNSEIGYSSKNDRIVYGVIGRNLTNNDTFTTYSITDYSKSSISQNLIKRFVLASVSFRF